MPGGIRNPDHRARGSLVRDLLVGDDQRRAAAQIPRDVGREPDLRRDRRRGEQCERDACKEALHGSPSYGQAAGAQTLPAPPVMVGGETTLAPPLPTIVLFV